MSRQSGLSFVELLVVMAIMGIVTTAIMTLHLNTQDQATSSEEVADLQQNVRVAIDEMANDIRMAGLLVFPDATAEEVIAVLGAPTQPSEGGDMNCWTGGGDNCFVIQTASASRRIARVGQNASDSFTINAGGTKAITMGNERMARLFSVNDLVRIYEPASLDQKDDVIFRVTAVSGSDVTISDYGSGNYSTGLPANQTYFSGETMVAVENDMVAQMSTVAPYETVAYFLDGNNRLMRQVNRNAAELLAENIDSVTLHYYLDDSTDVATVATGLNRIVSVRIEIVGEVDTPKGVKNRSMETMTFIRNRG